MIVVVAKNHQQIRQTYLAEELVCAVLVSVELVRTVETSCVRQFPLYRFKINKSQYTIIIKIKLKINNKEISCSG